MRSSVALAARGRFIRASGLTHVVSRGLAGHVAEPRGNKFLVGNRLVFGRTLRTTTRPRKVLMCSTLPALETACHMRIRRQQPAGGDVSISLPLRSSVFVFDCSVQPRMGQERRHPGVRCAASREQRARSPGARPWPRTAGSSHRREP